MSPEQAVGNRDLDSRSDIYGLACVLYELLAGVPPFEGPTPQVLIARRFAYAPKPIREHRPEVPTSVERALIKALDREPENRYATATEFGEAIKLPTEGGIGPATASEAAKVFSAETENLLARLRTIFENHYRVEDELPGGGMSRLFVATDIELGRKVVIKILPPEMMSPMMLARFKRESEVTARLQHPHILPVISAGVKEGLVHYVMPFVEGESLRKRLKREAQLPISDATKILREVVDALAYAHGKGIIHRDIKPENILIQDGHAVLADFGIAAALAGGGTEPGDRLTRTGMSLGTVGYMAPEQSLGEKTVDGRSDIYAVGIVGYEMFAGKPPFTGETDHQILVAHLTREAPPLDEFRQDAPPEVTEAIAKALEKDPNNRFQTAAEFRDALTVTVVPGTQPSIKRALWVRKFRRLHRKWKIAIPAVLVVALVAIGTFLWKARPTSAPGQYVTIAVAPFNVPSSSLSLWREGMVDVLARNLDGLGPLRTVSPTLSIRGFAGTADVTAATELARRTKARYAIFGTLVGASNASVTLRGTLVDTENEKADPWMYAVSDSTPEAAAGKFTVAVLDELKKSHTIGAVRQSSFGSSNVEAVRAFLQGEQFFRRTAWQSAASAYAHAISFDSSMAIALRRSAQVAGWQRNANDSMARAFWLKAGALNKGLSPRDSLLLLSDSLSATLAPLPSDSMNWQMLKRLFETVNDAASRYPDDPEVWFAVGEARFHLGYGSPANITERQALEAFDKAIALDSAFAPAYIHSVELGFNLDGAEAGRRYMSSYLRLNPTEQEAEGIKIVDRLTAPGGSSTVADSVLDHTSSDAMMAAFFTVRRWPDPGQTAVRLLEALKRRPRGSPTFASDSLQVWNFLPSELAYRGRLREAYEAMGNRPSRIFVAVAILGGIPADTLAVLLPRWVASGRPEAYTAMPLLAERHDDASLRFLINRANAESRVGSEIARRGARYRALSAQAYLSLAKRDTATAIKHFAALPDTLCIACYVDRLYRARLLATRGRQEQEQAANLLGERLNTIITPIEVLMAFERGRVAAKLGRRDDALRAYGLVAAAWSTGDPVLQPFVAEAKRESANLGGPSAGR
jgi:serine/threonine-protein kinase